jgi:hypothetical protein
VTESPLAGVLPTRRYVPHAHVLLMSSCRSIATTRKAWRGLAACGGTKDEGRPALGKEKLGKATASIAFGSMHSSHGLDCFAGFLLTTTAPTHPPTLFFTTQVCAWGCLSVEEEACLSARTATAPHTQPRAKQGAWNSRHLTNRLEALDEAVVHVRARHHTSPPRD